MSEKEIIIYVFMFSIGDKKFFTTPVWLFHRSKTSISVWSEFQFPSPVVRCLIFLLLMLLLLLLLLLVLFFVVAVVDDDDAIIVVVVVCLFVAAADMGKTAALIFSL